MGAELQRRTKAGTTRHTDFSLGQGICIEKNSALATRTSSATITPVTHTVANALVEHNESVAEHIKNADRVDEQFVESIDQVIDFLYGLFEQNLITESDIDAVLSIKPIGRSKQVSACFELIDSVVARVANLSEVDKLLERIGHSREKGVKYEFDMWFHPLIDYFHHSDVSNFKSEAGFENDAPYLFNCDYGCHALFIDIESIKNEAVRFLVIQLIYFCCRASYKVMSPEFYLEEIYSCLYFGGEPEEFDEIAKDCPDLVDELNEYKERNEDAKALFKQLETTLTKKSLMRIKAKAEKCKAAPDWISQTYQILIDGLNFDVNENQVAHCNDIFSVESNMPVVLSKDDTTVGILDTIHQCSMNGGEDAFLLLELSVEGGKLLRNIDLAENILSFIGTKINNEHN